MKNLVIKTKKQKQKKLKLFQKVLTKIILFLLIFNTEQPSQLTNIVTSE